MTTGNSLQRSVYSAEKTTILRLKKLNALQYMQADKIINLVLDQMEREKDLIYQVKVFSSYPFEMERIDTSQFGVNYSIPVESVGGGTPSCMTFYKNPQFLITVDKSQFKNPAQANENSEFQATFKAKDEDLSLKVHLCHAAKSVFRVTDVKDSLVVKSHSDDPFRHGFYNQKYTINGQGFYSLVISTFKPGVRLQGNLEIESKVKLNV